MTIAQAVLVGMAAMTASMNGIASMWAMSGRLGWLARAAPIVIVPAALLPLGMANVAVLAWLQAIVICASVWALRRIRAWRSKPAEGGDRSAALSGGEVRPALPRFRLADLLVVFVLAATVFGFASYSPEAWDIASWTPEDYLACLLAGTMLAVFTLVGWWIATLRCRWAWLGYGVLALIAGGVSVVDAQDAQTLVTCVAVVAGSLQILLTTVWLRLLAASGWNWWSLRKPVLGDMPSAKPEPGSRGTNRFLAARTALALLTTACLVLIGDLYWAVLPPTAPSNSPATAVERSSNGYVDLAAASRQIKWDAIPGGNLDAANDEQREQFVAENHLALSSARRALSVPSRVPLDSPTRLADLEAVRDLCRAFLLDAQVNWQTGRPSKSLDSYLDGLRLAGSTSRGGAILDELVASAIENTTLDALAVRLSDFDDLALKKLIDQCQSILANREPLAEIQNRYDPTTGEAETWTGRVGLWLTKRRLMVYDLVAVEQLPKIRTRRDTRLNLLILEAALRRYELASGRPADRLADLVPTILRRVPHDPLSNKPFVYRKTDNGHVLYSVGDNGIDDGGVGSTGNHYEMGDLLLAPRP